MKSLALWVEPKTNGKTEPPKAEVHVNVWKLPLERGGKFKRFIDIGIHLNNADDIENLFLYYPGKINKSDIYDLGDRITSSKKKLLNVLFNDECESKTNDNSDFIEIKKVRDDRVFSIYKLDPDANISVKGAYKGTKITISFIGSDIPKDVYIRFRIKHDYSDVFSHIDNSANSFLQSAFSKTEIIDFRLNEIRDLPNKFLEEIESDGVCYLFSKVHYFFICSSREELVSSQVPFMSSRQLEKDRWKDYIGNLKMKQEAILAYHWKAKENNSNGMNDFSALVQVKYEHNTCKTIIIYLIVLLLFSFLLNLGSAFIYDLIVN